MTTFWILAAFFAFVMTAVTIAGYFVSIRTRGNLTPEVSAQLSHEPALPRAHAAFLGVFRSIGESFPEAKREQNPYRRRLSASGYRWPSAVPVFYGIKAATTLLGASAAGVIALGFGGSLSAVPLPMLCVGAFAFMLPNRILNSRVRTRSRRLRSGLPAALDLLVVDLEAGQSLDSSIADCSRALKHTHPDLSAELAQLHFELKAGNNRADAFRGLSERNQEQELRKLANVLIDSDRFGVTLAPSLRSHNTYLRTRFRQQAQEAARKVGVKLVFPVFFLIFPSVLLVTLGPACIMMFQQLANMMR